MMTAEEKQAMVASLNGLLTDELTALDQYIPHKQRAVTWGYTAFVEYIEERIADERKHAEGLVKRIYEIGGTPDTVKRNLVIVGADLPGGLDRVAEEGAIAKYNTAIELAAKCCDNATRDLLAANLKDEDDHLRDIEMRLVQIAQMQPDQWLSTQN